MTIIYKLFVKVTFIIIVIGSNYVFQSAVSSNVLRLLPILPNIQKAKVIVSVI